MESGELNVQCTNWCRGRVSPLSCAWVNEFDVPAGERQRLDEHLNVINGAPMCLHDAGFRVPIDSLKNMAIAGFANGRLAPTV